MNSKELNDGLEFYQKNLYERARKHAIRYGYPELADDFAQEVAIKQLTGRKATVNQLFVDMLRGEYGDTRYSSGCERACTTNPKLQKTTVQLDRPTDSGTTRMLGHEFVPDTRTIPKPERNHRDTRKLFRDNDSQIDRACLILHSVWGLSEAEIGDCFGFSESRVSQRIGRIREEIRLREQNESSMFAEKMQVSPQDVSQNDAYKAQRDRQQKEPGTVSRQVQERPRVSESEIGVLETVRKEKRSRLGYGAEQEIPQAVFGSFEVNSF